MIVAGHEEGWAEVWRYLIHWLRGAVGDHANKAHTWDELHPASHSRQLGVVQLSGRSDYPAEGQPRPVRCVSSDAPCYVCFQPGKDVMVPGHPGLVDYPAGDCRRFDELGAYARGPAGLPRPRRGSPQLLFGGAVWTIPQGPDLYEPSRLVLYLCHKNASLRGLDYSIVQSETQPESVHAWEVERRIDLIGTARHASFCVVPEGKAGGYGHRAIAYLMLGCVPVFSKERFSVPFFEQAINWSTISLHVPPADMPRLPQILASADADALRRAAAGLRRGRKYKSMAGLGVLQLQLPQETKKCIITGSEKPHHALPRCCCGGSRSLADRWARDGPASYRLRIFISHTASPKSTFSTTRSHPYAYCEHRALYGLNQRVLLDTQRLYDTRTGFPSSEHNT